MEFTTHSYEVNFAGKKLVLETGKLAGLADGSIVAKCNETVVLATVVVGEEPREGVDFFPLLVDYEERFYAAGKISGSRFIKREGRPSDAAVLAARKIDRPLRPLFPKSYRNDIQVVITVLSYDGSVDPDVVATIAASSAIMMTNAPFLEPIASMRIGRIDNKFILNPTEEEIELSDLNLTVAGTKDRVMMIETEANEISEDIVFEGIKLAMAEMQPLIQIQHKIAEDHMRQTVKEEEAVSSIHAEIHGLMAGKIKEAIKELNKEERESKLKAYESEVLQSLEGTFKQIEIRSAFAKIVEKEVRSAILNEGFRPDGREMTEVRPLGIEVGILPRPHGSALFTRGQTQALTVATLASPGMEQLIDTMEGESTKRFMHHYNFPPFSTGEVRPMRGAGRREIGHGYLAEKALKPMIPDSDAFPYTIRLVSEILSSNGSSSMAATCGSTLALMDAGVPIKKPVAGIAMGLVTDEKLEKYKILTDLQGLEDFAGDMDFKIAGTADGVTAIQMDTKIAGLSMEIVENTFKQAKTGRIEILNAMLAVIDKPRSTISKYAPKIEMVKINPEKIGDLIGPGGKTIKKIIDECGGKELTSIDIEDDGTVMIASIDLAMGEKAITMVQSMTREILPGEVMTGEVVEIKKDRMSGKEIGAIVKLSPRTDGMIHISQISKDRIDRVSDVLKIGDTVTVKVVEVDPLKNRISLSIKDLDN